MDSNLGNGKLICTNELTVSHHNQNFVKLALSGIELTLDGTRTLVPAVLVTVFHGSAWIKDLKSVASVWIRILFLGLAYFRACLLVFA